jgi:hypothetical protein
MAASIRSRCRAIPVVVFTYSRDQIFRVLSAPLKITTIEFPDDEQIVGDPAWGETPMGLRHGRCQSSLREAAGGGAGQHAVGQYEQAEL